MITNDTGIYEITCDACPESETAPLADTWNEAWASFRDYGWRARKIGGETGEWIHLCPACIEDRHTEGLR